MIEDEARDATLVEHALRQGGLDFCLKRVDTRSAFLEELAQFHPSVILSDRGLPGLDGLAALSLAQKQAPNIPFIFVTGSLGQELAIQALKSGATDLVLKRRLGTLPSAVRRALQQVELRPQQRQAQDTLHSSEEHYRDLVEFSPDALLVLVEESVAFVNAAAVKLFGASQREQLVGRNIRDLVSPPDWERFQQFVFRVREEGKPGPSIEQTLQRLDGSRIAAEIAAAPLVFAGKPAAQVIVRDVSEQERAHEEIRRMNAELEKRVADRTAELEAANKELEAFSYSVSHDLRAPLRHIEGFIEILMTTKIQSLDEESKRHLATISDSARQMGRLIDDLLAFSRTERAELRKTELELTDLLRSCVRDLDRELKGRQVEWIVAELPRVHADPALLRQVLTNLLSNALKYTRPRKVARIEVGSRNEGAEHIIFVRDNGVGFDPRYKHKLFAVFQRLHRAVDFEGTGVGLANVRRIISRHGGRTWAEGQIDKGATFYFSLPRA